MTKLPVVSGAALVTALEKSGFQVLRQRGSHIILQRRHGDRTLTTVVPNHKELAKGTLRVILKKVEMSPEELTKLLTVLLGTVTFLK